MNNKKSNLPDVFQSIVDAIHPTKKPFNRLLDEDLSQPVNLQKEHEQIEYMKKIMWQYKEDVLNPNLPEINFTTECEAIYVRAALIGAGIGMDGAIGILKKTESPTINRHTGTILDEKAHESIN